MQIVDNYPPLGVSGRGLRAATKYFRDFNSDNTMLAKIHKSSLNTFLVKSTPSNHIIPGFTNIQNHLVLFIRVPRRF